MQQQKMAFPDVLAEVDTALLLRAYREGPARVRRVMAGLTPSELSARARGEGRWSVREILIHLADSELVGATRVRLALAQRGPAFPMYDQDQWATALRYQDMDAGGLERALVLFNAIRATTAPLYESAAATGQLDRTGVHPDFGSITVRQLLELYADHSERHIEQILCIRALLGRHLEFPLLITARLY